MQTNKKSFTEFAAATLPASVLAEKSEYCFQLKFCRERERVPFDLKFKQTSSSVLPPYSCTQGKGDKVQHPALMEPYTVAEILVHAESNVAKTIG
jgi:hypothetical protein